MPRGKRKTLEERKQKLLNDIEELNERINNIQSNKNNLMEELKQIELEEREEKVGGLLAIMEEKQLSVDQLTELLVTTPEPSNQNE